MNYGSVSEADAALGLDTMPVRQSAEVQFGDRLVPTHSPLDWCRKALSTPTTMAAGVRISRGYWHIIGGIRGSIGPRTSLSFYEWMLAERGKDGLVVVLRSSDNAISQREWMWLSSNHPGRKSMPDFSVDLPGWVYHVGATSEAALTELAVVVRLAS